MSLYDDLKPVASALLAEFKQGTIKLIQVTAGSGAADNPGAPTETVTTLTATTKGAPFKYMKEGLTVQGDLQVIAAVVEGITPTKNDFIEVDGSRYKIIEDISAPGAGTRVVWKFLLRKG